VSPSGDIILQNYYSGSNDTANVHLLQPNPFVFAPSSVTIATKIALGATEMNFIPYRNMPLTQAYAVTSSGSINFKLTTTSVNASLLTPMVDMDRTNVVVVENIIDSSNSTTEETTSTSGNATNTVARYISKRINLPSGESAKELKVIFDLNKPIGSFISVYGKVADTSINAGYNTTDSYSLMSVDGDNPFATNNASTSSQSQFDFREISYKLVPTKDFDTFSVKVCMYSSNPCNVPIIKNLRIVAIE
jgi:hypothetical protein